MHETVLVLVSKCCIVVFDRMLISILSMSVAGLEMLSEEGADALAPRDGDLKPDDLLTPLHLICPFKRLNLF